MSGFTKYKLGTKDKGQQSGSLKQRKKGHNQTNWVEPGLSLPDRSNGGSGMQPQSFLSNSIQHLQLAQICNSNSTTLHPVFTEKQPDLRKRPDLGKQAIRQLPEL